MHYHNLWHKVYDLIYTYMVLVPQSLCDICSPSGTLLDLSDWAFFCLLVKEFYGTRYQRMLF